MNHIKLFEEFLNENKVDKLIDWKDFYIMAKDKSGYNSEFEKKYGKLLDKPHIANAIKTAKDFNSFIKFVKQFKNEFLNEDTTTPVKYVVWNLYSRDNKRVEQCSVVFTNKIAYHAQVPRPMEQHHPKLFQIQNGRNVRTELALDLGVISPTDSYSLTCGLENKIVKFLNFWKSEGYTLVYMPDTMNEGLFKEWIDKNGLVKFTKNTL